MARGGNRTSLGLGCPPRPATARSGKGRGLFVAAGDDPHHLEIDANKSPKLDHGVLAHP